MIQRIIFRVRLFGRWFQLARFTYNCVTKQLIRETKLGRIPVEMVVQYEPFR